MLCTFQLYNNSQQEQKHWRLNIFTLNEKEYDESKLSDKGKAAYVKLIRIAEQKSDLDIVANHWTAQLQAELPKDEVTDGSESKEQRRYCTSRRQS